MGTEQRAPAYQFPRIAKTRIRKNLFEVVEDKGELTQLTDAYAALKALPKDDPRAWCNQANIHDQHCSYPRAQPSDPAPYYLQIHFGWYFLPWHRAYLYFYETILGGLIKDDSFALPYWDWTLNPTVPDVLFDPTSPLYDAKRVIAKGQSIKNDFAVFERTKELTIRLIKDITYFFAPLFALTGSFGGPPDSDESDTLLEGALERNPHNAIHTWVGGDTGDMGSFDTAARDFLFFCHHANVDKIWADWLLSPSHTNTSSQTWLSQSFNFYDADGKPVSVTVADTLDFAKVNVLYKPYQAPSARLFAAHEAAAKPQILAGKPVTTEAKSPLLAPARVRPEAQALVGRKVRLVIEGFQDPGDIPMRIHAFVDKPDADANTPLTSPNYVGTIFLVPMRAAKAGAPMAKMGMHRAHSLSLDVSERAAPLLGGGQPSQVTLVPVTNDGKPSPGKVQFKSVYLVVED